MEHRKLDDVNRSFQTGDNDPLLSQYLAEIAASTPLSPQEEAALAVRIRNGDESARNALVEANLRFVISVAKEYQNRGLPLSELISAGNVGLLTAAERFDETRGYKFISYAVWWIRQSILQALTEQSTVRMPVNRIDLRTKILRAYESLQHEGRIPTLEQVADTLGCTEEKVEQALIENQPIRSLDAPLEEGEGHCLLDLLWDREQLSPEEEMLKEALKEDIDKVLEGLEPREAEILRLYYGLADGPPMTLDQIGTRFRLTRERVRQIKEIALSKLRHPRLCSRLRTHASL